MEHFMNDTAASKPDHEAMLNELAELGMRAARVVVRLMETERAAVDLVAGWLPEPCGFPAALEEATAAGQAVDSVDAALALAVPRTEVLARALGRVSRSVRRSVALVRRMQAGWTGAGRADTRQAMVRRQVARGVGEVIARAAEGERAEQLFDELAERLDDPGLEDELLVLPVAVVVRRVCQDLGLAVEAAVALAMPSGEGVVDSC